MIFSLFEQLQRLTVGGSRAITTAPHQPQGLAKRSLMLGILLLTTFYWQSALASTASADASGALTLKQALQQTLSSNAALQLYPYQHQQALALAEQASIKPLPTLALELENIAGNGHYSALDNAEMTLTLSQNIELGNKRDNRITYANASAQQQHMEFEITRLDVLAETSRRYYSLLQMQSLQTLLQERLAQEGKALQLARRRARAGALGEAEVAKIALRAAITQQQINQLQAQQQQWRLRLSSMWQREPDFDQVSGVITNLPEIPDREQVLAALKGSPLLMQQQAQLRLADAQLLVAQSLASSNLNIGIGIRHFEGSGDQALNASISMPLAFSNPNQGRINAAQTGKEKLQRQQQLQLQQLRLQLIDMQLKMQQWAEAIIAIENQLLPQAQRLQTATFTGFSKGRYSVLQWLDAQGDVFALQQQHIEKSAQVYLTLLELERITGQALHSPNITDDKQ